MVALLVDLQVDLQVAVVGVVALLVDLHVDSLKLQVAVVGVTTAVTKTSWFATHVVRRSRITKETTQQITQQTKLQA